MSQYGVTRYGEDSPALIGTSGNMLAESTALPPAEPQYGTMVPFFPPGGPGSSIVSGQSALEDTGPDIWTAYPGKLDINCYVGDDVQIPLYFVNPSDPMLDMSDENGWAWRAQIRVWHDYRATLVNEFAIAIDFVPPDPEIPDDIGKTKLTMFLPRFLNTVIGDYRWDLVSTSPFVGPVYPPPPGWEEPDPDNPIWPPADEVRTWLYGDIHIVRRITATDVLPPA